MAAKKKPKRSKAPAPAKEMPGMMPPADEPQEDQIVEVKDKKERIDILKKFTKQVLKKYGPLVRSVVLFGSTAREEWKGKSDIDVFVILDDTRQKMTPMIKDRIENLLRYHEYEKALIQLELIIKKYPGTAAAKWAKAKIKLIEKRM